VCLVRQLLHAQFKTSGSAAFDCTWHAKTGRLVLRHFLDNGAHEFDIAPRALRLQYGLCLVRLGHVGCVGLTGVLSLALFDCITHAGAGALRAWMS